MNNAGPPGQSASPWSDASFFNIGFGNAKTGNRIVTAFGRTRAVAQ